MKYPLLFDETWLKEKYELEKLSCKQIGDLIGCSKDGVRVALLRYQIPLRTSKESNHLIFDKDGGKSKLYDSLNDEKWLRQKYEIEGLSTKEIATLIGAKTPNSVRQALIRKKIEIRTISDGLTFKRRMKDDGDFICNIDVVVGCLLGDAGLNCYNRHSNLSYPYFYKKNKYYDHVTYVTNLLFKDGGKCRIKEYCRANDDKTFKCFTFKSFCNKDLLQIYRDWYPESNNYVKLVPKNIEINETVLLHWFMDDGSASYRKRDGKITNQVVLVFCSESFSKDDQQWLCDRINEKFDFGARVIKTRCRKKQCGTGWRIRIPQSKVNKFFEVIGPCPVASMQYKWKHDGI